MNDGLNNKSTTELVSELQVRIPIGDSRSYELLDEIGYRIGDMEYKLSEYDKGKETNNHIRQDLEEIEKVANDYKVGSVVEIINTGYIDGTIGYVTESNPSEPKVRVDYFNEHGDCYVYIDKSKVRLVKE